MYSNVYVYSKSSSRFNPYDNYIASSTEAKPVYVRGSARRVSLRVEKGDYIIYVWMVRNFKKRVKGYILLFNHKGELVFKAKYVDGALRRSLGSPVYAWLIKMFVEQLKIPVSEIKLGD